MEKRRGKEVKVIYEDDNVYLADKAAGIEVVSESGEEDFLALARRASGADLRAVHRLDRNTGGLVAFAKNEAAENELLAAFDPREENSRVRKIYIAEVCGAPFKPSAELTAYLFKDAKKAMCYVSNVPKPGYKKIITKYRVLKAGGGTALLEVEPVTGRTHQIRAHLAFVGHPVAGDGKYGSEKENRRYRARYQRLLAYSLRFFFPETCCLRYLNGRVFTLNRNYPE